MGQTTIAHTPVQYTGLTYQVVTSYANDKNWLNAVNILLNNKIIEKIKLNNIEYKQDVAKQIAFNFIQKKLTTNKKTTRKQKVNKSAKATAASNLMNDLNI